MTMPPGSPLASCAPRLRAADTPMDPAVDRTGQLVERDEPHLHAARLLGEQREQQRGELLARREHLGPRLERRRDQADERGGLRADRHVGARELPTDSSQPSKPVRPWRHSSWAAWTASQAGRGGRP